MGPVAQAGAVPTMRIVVTSRPLSGRCGCRGTAVSVEGKAVPSNMPIRRQISFSVERQDGESWEAAHQRAAAGLTAAARAHGAVGVVALSVALLEGATLRLTAQPSGRSPS
jgi:hypothetical protein